MAYREEGTITLKMLATDLASGKVGTFIGNLDKLAQKGGLVGSVAQGVGQSFGQMLNPIGLVTKGLGMVTDFLGDAGRAASDLNETNSKLSAVFTSQADSIRAWAADSAQSMGMSTQAALEATGTFGNFLMAMGQAEAPAADMSKAMVQLASDLGSFNNADPTEVLMALRSGLSGETEPLRQFGVDISDAAVQAELLASGVKKVGGQFSTAEKIQGRYRLIMRQTVTAQGDFNRTATGTANATKTAAAETENLKGKMGELVNNVSNVAAQLSGEAANSLTNAIDAVGTAWNDLMRAVNPALAFEQDVDKAIRAQAESMGLNAVALMEFSDAQRQAFKDSQAAIEEHSHQLELAAIALQITGTATDEQRAQMEDWIKVNLEAADATDQTTEAVDGLTEEQRAATAMVQAFIAAGQPAPKMLTDIGDAAGDAAGGVATAKGQITELAVALPGNIADGLRSGVSEVRSAAKALRAAILNPMKPINDLAYIRGQLTGKDLKKGLASQDPYVAAQARVTRRTYLDNLNGIVDGGYIAGYDAGAALIDGLRASGVLDQVAGLFGLGGAREYQTPKGSRPKGFSKWSAKKRRNWLEKHPGRASGGPVSAGESYLVGEDGPEILQMGGSSGNVVPNHKLGGVTFIYSPQYSTASPIEAQRFAEMVLPDIERALARRG